MIYTKWTKEYIKKTKQEKIHTHIDQSQTDKLNPKWLCVSLLKFKILKSKGNWTQYNFFFEKKILNNLFLNDSDYM